jgi:hypothetical protein
MSVSLPRSQSPGPWPGASDPILSAVLDDVRTTLRVAWIDPALRALSAEPTFLAAAWAATRPNVTRSFVIGAERLQREALDAARAALGDSEGDEWAGRLGSAEREHLVRTTQALHHSAARVYLVVQSWATLARRHSLPGTGREEPPAKRGVPSWQEGLIGLPRSVSEETDALIDVATASLGLASTPSALQAVAPWPHFLEALVAGVRGVERPAWAASTTSLRRSASEILQGLPHPMDLQWDVLERKGLSDERRVVIADHLTAATASMPANAIIAAAAWLRSGAPDLPSEF